MSGAGVSGATGGKSGKGAKCVEEIFTPGAHFVPCPRYAVEGDLCGVHARRIREMESSENFMAGLNAMIDAGGAVGIEEPRP